ncbi:hypothetical protein [Alteromonas gracilis]|uniref:hypothetical protein n=1 Tax=Alteromonas gracilis TaxID=1479524 RepID=UPI0037360628
MQLQRAGGIAAIVCALTYLFGFVLFFGLIDPPADTSDIGHLQFLVSQRDTFYMGYIVIGIVFSLGLLLLNQSLQAVFKNHSSIIARYNSTIGNMWATFVMASTFIFLVSLPFLANYADTNEDSAAVVLKSVDIVVDALGGGIELLGAIWVLLISYMGIKHGVYAKATHVLGVAVGIAGILTLFSGLSFFSGNVLFEASTAIFGLGQIVWFILIGLHMTKASR